MSALTSFNEFWTQLQRLRPIGPTEAWSLSGKTRSTFEITSVDETSITVTLALGGVRRIPRSNFEKLFARWDDYKSERLPRHELSNLSQNSTYILTILHLIEQA
jgi:hypothetical protein